MRQVTVRNIETVFWRRNCMEHVLHLYFFFFRLVDQRVKIVSRIRKELIGKGFNEMENELYYQYDKRYFVKLDPN